MVMVPTQKTQTTAVGAAPTGFQNPNVPSGAFDQGGAALAQGGQQLQGLGEQMAQAALQMQNEDNEAEIKEKDNLLSQATRTTMYGDGSADNKGYYSLERKSAVEGYATTEDQLRQAMNDIIADSSNDAVKLKVSQLGAVRLERELTGMTKHASVEREKNFDEIGTARVAQANSDATSAWNSPPVMNNSLGIAEEENADYAERHNLAPEVAAVRLQQSQGVVVKGAFDAALAGDNIQVAEKLLAEHGGKIDPAVRTSMEEDLRKQTISVKGQVLADGAILRFPNDPAAARKWARDAAEGKVRDAALTRVNRQISERRSDAAEKRQISAEAERRIRLTEAKKNRLDKEADKAAKSSAWTHVKDGGSVDDLTAQEIELLPAATISSMRAFETSRVKRGSGYAVISKSETVNELHQLFMGDKVAFAQRNLLEELPNLTENDLNYWQAQQRSVDVRNEKALKKNNSYTLADRMAKEYLSAANIGFGQGAKGADPEKSRLVLGLARDYIDSLPEGATFDRKALDRVLSGAFLSGEVDGSGFFSDDEGRRFEFRDPKSSAKFIITDIEDQTALVATATGVPEEHVLAIAKALADRNKPVTEENVRRTYEAATQGRGR